MRKREGKAGARGRLRVNGYIEHINLRVMSNICVPGGRSSGWNGEGVAHHMQTQDSIYQELPSSCVMCFCLRERPHENCNFYCCCCCFSMYWLLFSCMGKASVSMRLIKIRRDEMENKTGIFCPLSAGVNGQRWQSKSSSQLCRYVINGHVVMKWINLNLKPCVCWDL